jgi:putative ABC transport system permease protein
MRVAQTTIEGVEASIRGLDPAQGTTMRALYLREGPNADLSFSAQQDANDALVRSLAGGMTAIISEGLARATGIGIGDTLTLTVEAGSWPLSVIAVASDYFPATGDRGILVDQDVLALLFPDAPISEVYIGITDEQYRDQLFAELTALFSARSISIWDQLATRDMSIASGERGLSIFYILAAVVMIPSVLGLLNTLVINVLERTHEIGLLRASGADRGHVRRMITAEALLLGAVSAVIGLACGVVLGYGVLETFTALSQGNGEMFTFSLPVTALALMLVVGMAIVWAAAWLPARRAARLDVLTALRAD